MHIYTYTSVSLSSTHSLSYNNSTAYFKASAIHCLLLQFPVSSRYPKILQYLLTSSSSFPCPALPPRKRPGFCCLGVWVSPGPIRTGYGKSRPHRDSIPDPPAHSESVYLVTPFHRSVLDGRYLRYKTVEWIPLLHDSNTWYAVVNSIMNLQASFCLVERLFYLFHCRCRGLLFHVILPMRHTFYRTALAEWSARHRGLYLQHYTSDIRDKHSCPRRDSHSWSQQLSGRRFGP